MRQFPWTLLLLFTSLAYGQVDCRAIFGTGPWPPTELFQNSEPIHLKLKSHFKQIEISSDNERKKELPRSYAAEWIWPDGSVTQARAEAFGDSAANSDEATFRKLHVTLDDQARQEIYIETHVQNQPTKRWTPQGRLTDGTSPYREGLVYDLADALGIAAPAHRRASIEYTDLETGETLTRPALLLENFQETIRRLGANHYSQDDLLIFKSHAPKGAINVSVADAAQVYLFQAMIGNSDFVLEIFNSQRAPNWNFNDLKNIALYRVGTEGPIKPLVYDFDIASMVAGYEMAAPSKPWAIMPQLYSDPVTVTMLRALFELRMLVRDSVFREVTTKFQEKEKLLRKVIANATVDETGRALALDHINHFFEALKQVWRSDVRFIYSDKYRLYPAPKVKGSILQVLRPPPWHEPRPRPLRYGSPFIILGEEGDFLKVLFLNTHYDLKNAERNVGYIKKDAPYGDSLP